MRNKKLINRRNDLTQGEQSSTFFNIALKKTGKKKKKKKVIAAQGIRIWSPIQLLTLSNRAYNFVERTKHVAVLVVSWGPYAKGRLEDQGVQ